MRGRPRDGEIKERAIAMLMSGDNQSYVSSKLDLPLSTVATWKREIENGGLDFTEIRNKRKEEFINGAWGIIDKAKRLLERRLERALEREDGIDRLIDEVEEAELSEPKKKALTAKLTALKVEDIGKVAVVLGTLYDKQALANREATQIIDGDLSVKKFEDFE